MVENGGGGGGGTAYLVNRVEKKLFVVETRFPITDVRFCRCLHVNRDDNNICVRHVRYQVSPDPVRVRRSRENERTINIFTTRLYIIIIKNNDTIIKMTADSIIIIIIL